VIERYQRLVFSIALKIDRDRGEAEGLTQFALGSTIHPRCRPTIRPRVTMGTYRWSCLKAGRWTWPKIGTTAASLVAGSFASFLLLKGQKGLTIT
jgi:hypothetical protein